MSESKWRCPFCDTLNRWEETVCCVCGEGKRDDAITERQDGNVPFGQGNTLVDSGTDRNDGEAAEGTPPPPEQRRGGGGFLKALLLAGAVFAVFYFVGRNGMAPSLSFTPDKGDSDAVELQSASLLTSVPAVAPDRVSASAPTPDPTRAPTPDPTQAPASTPVAAIKSYPTLSRGSKGTDVTSLQSQLARLGYSPGAVDGDYGNKTEEAVKRFQGDHGLDPTGTADSATQVLLYALTPSSGNYEIDLSDQSELDALADSLWYGRRSSDGMLVGCFVNSSQTVGGVFGVWSSGEGNLGVRVFWIIGGLTFDCNYVTIEEPEESVTLYREPAGGQSIHVVFSYDEDSFDMVLDKSRSASEKSSVLYQVYKWMRFEYELR